MPFEDDVKQLCEQLIACTSEEQAVVLARQLQGLMHDRIEDLRCSLLAMPSLDSS